MLYKVYVSFIQVDSDATKTLESKVQRSLRKLKSKLSSYEEKKLYPTGSSPGKFYGTAKLYKLPVNGTIDDLPICQYTHCVKHQHNHISVSESSIESTVFIQRIRTQHQKYKRLHLANKKRTHSNRI